MKGPKTYICFQLFTNDVKQHFQNAADQPIDRRNLENSPIVETVCSNNLITLSLISTAVAFAKLAAEIAIPRTTS